MSFTGIPKGQPPWSKRLQERCMWYSTESQDRTGSKNCCLLLAFNFYIHLRHILHQAWLTVTCSAYAMHLPEIHWQQPLTPLRMASPHRWGQKTDTLSYTGSCIMKEEHSYRCGNVINCHLIQHSKSRLYICMSTDTFNTPKERGEDCWKIMDCCLSLSLYIYIYTKENIQKNTHPAFTSCLTSSVSSQCYALVWQWASSSPASLMSMGFDRQSCSANLKFCLT